MNIDRVAKIERAIKEKYGEEYIRNIKSLSTPKIDLLYKEQIKEIKERRKAKKEKKSFKCGECNKYIYSKTDKFYFLKHDLCEECYIMFKE